MVKKGGKKSMKKGKSTMRKKGKSTMRKKGGKVAVGMRQIYNKVNVTWKKKKVPFTFNPPPTTRNFAAPQDDYLRIMRGAEKYGRATEEISAESFGDIQPYTPPERGNIFRKFNVAKGSANIKHVSEKDKQERLKAKHTLLGLKEEDVDGLVKRRMALLKMQKSNLFPQKRATSRIRLAKKSRSKSSTQGSGPHPDDEDSSPSGLQNEGRSKNSAIESLKWDAGGAMPLSSPHESLPPCVVTKHEITINRNPKDSLGIRLVTDNGIVIVTSVNTGSLGAKNGIEVNDVIVAVNDTIIKGAKDDKLTKPSSKVKLLVYRIQ